MTISTGIINTIAGSTTTSYYSGDGGAATSAALNNAVDVALDSSGRHLCIYSSNLCLNFCINGIININLNINRQRVHR